MTKHILFRVLAGLVLLAAIAGIAYFAFSVGKAQNITANAQLPAAQEANQPNLYYGHGFPFLRPFHFFGFGCFGPLALLFLLCMAFCAMRRMIWGPRWGWHRMHHRQGPWSEKDSGECVPPMFHEWHRRMHNAPEEEKPSNSEPAKK